MSQSLAAELGNEGMPACLPRIPQPALPDRCGGSYRGSGFGWGQLQSPGQQRGEHSAHSTDLASSSLTRCQAG
jgi:hypothetical protein